MKSRRPLFVAPPIRLWIGLLSAIGGTAVPKALGQLPPPQLFPPGWPPSSPVSYVNLDLDADSKIDFYYVAFRIQRPAGSHAGWLKFSPIEWPYVKLPEAYVFSSFGPESYGFRLLDFEIHPVAGEPLITGRGPGNDIALRQRSGKVFLDLPTPTPNSVLETSTDLKTWSPAPVTGSGLRQEIQPPAEGKVYYRHRPSV